MKTLKTIILVILAHMSVYGQQPVYISDSLVLSSHRDNYYDSINDEVYISGRFFDTIDSTSHYGTVKFDGTNWETISTFHNNMDSIHLNLIVHKDTLYCTINHLLYKYNGTKFVLDKLPHLYEIYHVKSINDMLFSINTWGITNRSTGKIVKFGDFPIDMDDVVVFENKILISGYEASNKEYNINYASSAWDTTKYHMVYNGIFSYDGYELKNFSVNNDSNTYVQYDIKQMAVMDGNLVAIIQDIADGTKAVIMYNEDVSYDTLMVINNDIVNIVNDQYIYDNSNKKMYDIQNGSLHEIKFMGGIIPSVGGTFIIDGITYGITKNSGVGELVKYVDINQHTSDFSYESTNDCEFTQVHFTDKSDGAISWNWNFGGAMFTNTSTKENPSVVYQNTGMYDVTLISENIDGVVDTVIKTIYVGCIITKVEELAVKISVYPNPTTDYVNISGITNQSVEIFQENGSLVYKGVDTSIDFTKQPRGTYIVKVGDITKRMIKQ